MQGGFLQSRTLEPTPASTNALASINILQLEDTWKTMAYRSAI